MHVSVETTGSLGRRMKVAVPAAKFEQEFSNRLKRLSQTVRVPGFRPGKVPLKMIEAQYGGRLLQEVASDLIQNTFYQAAGEQGLRPAGGPKIEPKAVARGQDFEYTAEFEIYPEIKSVQTPSVAIERLVCTVMSEDVDRTLETMRKQRVRWQPVDRAAREGDRLEIDFQGKLAGVPFEGGEAHGFPLVLGSHSLIDGFEQQLIGASAGEQRTVSVTFPADYRNAKLAGQEVEFLVSVKQVSEAVLPEVDQAFLEQLGMSGATVEGLKKEIQGNLEREAEGRVKARLKQQVLKALMQANPLEIPQGLLTAEADRLAQMTRANLEAQGVPAEKLPSDGAAFMDQARERVALGLLLAEFVRTEEITADAGKVRARVEQMAASYESPQEFVQWYYARAERLAEVESLVLEDQAVERILDRVTTADKSISFQELLTI